MNLKIFISLITVAILVFAASLAFIEIENNGTKMTTVPEDSAVETAQPTCFVGGCSNEICSAEQGVVSTCIYKEEYACYQAAACERQSDGQCGWTQTVELTSCLMGK